MQSLVIRKATFDDINTMLILENCCFKTDRLSKQRMRYLLGKAKAITVIAEQKKQVRGYAICLLPAHPRPARLYSIAVSPEHQGHGIAKQLIRHLFLVLVKHQYQRCHLEVRESQVKAQKLYQQFGFNKKITLPHYYQDGESAIRMETNL